jgi:hypothetical protein
MLPPGVHLIVSIKRQISSITVESDDLILKKSKSSNGDGVEKKDEGNVPQMGLATQSPPLIVSFFLNNYNEKIPVDLAENCLFEFPYSFKKSEANDLVVKYVRNELEKHDRTINEKWLQIIASSCLSQAELSGASSGGSGSDTDSAQISFLYLNLMIKEVISANPLNNSLKHLLDEKDIPKDLESVIKFKIGNIMY